MRTAVPTTQPKPPILFAMIVFLVLVTLEITAILILNNGQFIFTLDDPYIHLSLAENILQGHYSVNAREYAAPSSSIIWPFFIAPFTYFSNADWLVLVTNILFSTCTLAYAARVLKLSQASEKYSLKQQVTVLVILMLAVNLIGLCFVGMEHSLQVLVAVIIAVGLIEKAEGNNPSWLLWLAIIIAPLVRYENVLISAAALLYLFCQKEYAKSILSGFVIMAAGAAFSLFLLGIGLHYLPDSVLAKSAVATVGASGLLGNFLANFMLVTTLPKAICFTLLAIFLLVWPLLQPRAKEKRLLAWIVAMALLAHLLAGRIGWYFRYEMAMWAFSLTVFFYLCYDEIFQSGRKISSLCAKVMAGAVILVAYAESLVVLGTTPLASSNIYHQQYQLHRFITEIYKKPVAVNDLGWTSYKNDLYVLDLWGLGSSQARELRQTRSDVQWMDDLVAEKNIQLIMIYNNPIWFPNVPSAWEKIAELDIKGSKITAHYPVIFFARNHADKSDITAQLKVFAEQLPDGSIIRFVD